MMLEGRKTEPEWMDGPDFGPAEVAGTFRFLVPVNRVFGGIGPGLDFFRRESRTWDPERTYCVLDAGAGVGDFSRHLARWARRSGYRLSIRAIDHHPLVVEEGRTRSRGYPEITFAQEDVLALDGPVCDYVHASQLVHHFADDEVVPLLEHLRGLCRRKVVVNDLVRAPLHYLGTWLLTFFGPAVFRHDARISVRRGFKMDELAALLRAGGVRDYQLERHFFYRFLLIVRSDANNREG
jgi:SAM-dependent methyltransferase